MELMQSPTNPPPPPLTFEALQEFMAGCRKSKMVSIVSEMLGYCQAISPLESDKQLFSGMIEYVQSLRLETELPNPMAFPRSNELSAIGHLILQEAVTPRKPFFCMEFDVRRFIPKSSPLYSGNIFMFPFTHG